MQHDPNAMALKLRALDGGAYTQMRLTGPVATVPQRAQVRRLLSMLAFWHGGPVDVVLSVDEWAGWLEVWVDALQTVPQRHATIRFLISSATLPGQHVDDDGL